MKNEIIRVLAKNIGCEPLAIADTLFPVSKGYTEKERMDFMFAIHYSMTELLLLKELETFEKHDWDSFHDTVYNSTGEDCNREQLIKIYQSLPHNLKCNALEWGMSDTVFRDNVYEHLGGE